MAGTKLVVFGLSVSSAWGNGHATLWRGLIRALGAQGHRVVFFERDVPFYAAHRDLTELPELTLVLYRELADIQALVAQHLTDADAAVVTSYCPDGAEAATLVLNAPVPRRVFYDLDTPITLSAVGAGERVAYLPREGLSGFDLVLSYTGGPALEALRKMLGARRVAPLYGAVDPSQHRPSEPAGPFLGDLSYLGTYAANRQSALARLFLEPARRCPDRTFVLGGAMYPDDFPWTKNVRYVRHIAPDAHPAFYCSSRLTLNVTRGPMAAMGYCPSARLFEAAACGVPVLSDGWDGLSGFFTPGREILLTGSPEETVAALSLAPEELKRIGRCARDRTLSEHTAAHRAESLLELLFDSAPSSGATEGIA